MVQALDRADFLRGALGRGAPPLRPPWSPDEHSLDRLCTRCDTCLGACPEGILVRGRGGLPEIDFARGTCSFCGACVRTCIPRALSFGHQIGERPWNYRAEIAETCLSRQGVTCRSCSEHCEEDAIAFRLALGGRADPRVDDARCNGCGACVAVCPADAISIAPGAAGEE